MKILIGIFLIISVVSSQVSAQTADADTAANKRRIVNGQQYTVKSHRGKKEKTLISPVTPASGITTGLVVIYGQVVKPPYQVTVNAEKTLINSVPVGVMAGERGTLPARAGMLVERANDIFCDMKSGKSDKKKAEEILALFEKSTDAVVTAKWLNNTPPPQGVLLVNWRSGGGRHDLRFNVPTCRVRPFAKAKVDGQRRTQAGNNAETIKKSLEAGDMLVFASDGGTTTLPITAKEQITSALQDTSLARKDLLGKLEAVGLSRRAAMDVMRRYNPNAWE